MANLIQIKRAITATAPGSLANGEIAYSGNTTSDSLFIGNPNGGAVTRIAGAKFGYVFNSTPGTLTSNSTIITDSNGFINTIKVGNTTINAVVNSTSLALSNSTSSITITIPSAAVAGDGNYYLNANGAYAFVNTSAAPGGSGSNTYIMFNDSGVQNTNIGFTFNKTTNTIFVANTINVGANVNLTTTQLNVGNSTVNAVQTQTSFVVANSTATTTANTLMVSVGANSYINAISYFVGNSTVNAVITQTQISVGNATVNSVISGSAISTGGTLSVTNVATFSNNATVSGLLTASAGVAVTGTANATIAINVGANVNISTSQLNVGNSTVNSVVTSSSIATTGTLGVTGAATFSNTSGHTGAATFSNTIAVTGNATFSNTIVVAGDVTPSANVTYNLGSLGKSWLNIYANTINSKFVTIDNDLTVSGNLTVTGTLATINVVTLSVTDSLIHLASNNTTTDIIDIGVYGDYGNSTVNFFSGVFRDASDGSWKVFDNLQAPPSTTVDTANTTYRQGVLQSYLNSGALTSNATSVYVTANSTVNVNFSANTLILSTPLPGTSGGTGLATYTSQDIIVANSTNGFTKLGIGSEGYVLQVNSGVLAYNTLDGGTF